MRAFEARALVEQAALRSIAAHHCYAEPSNPHADAEDEYAADHLALAARDLVRAVEALPKDQRPVGWDRTFDLPKAEWEPIATTLRSAELAAADVPARYAEALQLVVQLIDAPGLSEYERIRRIKLVIVAFGHVNAAREQVA